MKASAGQLVVISLVAVAFVCMVPGMRLVVRRIPSSEREMMRLRLNDQGLRLQLILIAAGAPLGAVFFVALRVFFETPMALGLAMLIWIGQAVTFLALLRAVLNDDAGGSA